jgi:glyoxylase-like metal-dependent hydrolase (beta-lactamase superfamily II)
MTKVYHINCGFLHVPPQPKVICHCLLLEDQNGLALVDTGIGLLDVRLPMERLGRSLIENSGFILDEANTAFRQIEKLGLRPADVRHIVLTHCDADHAGGLSDFPQAAVHVSAEELSSLEQGQPRYRPIQFAHGPHWQTYPPSTQQWFGLEARPVALDFQAQVLLIPLFGHTLGHCGVAVKQEDRWVLYVGDAYYLKVETLMDDHPVSALSAQAAVVDEQRRRSLAKLKQLLRDYPGQIEMFSFHDPTEFPPEGLM